MKKAVILLVASIMLAACNNEDKSENTSDSPKNSAATESSQEQSGAETADEQVGLEEGLKGDSTEVDYENIAKGDVPANKKVSFTGTVFKVEEGRYGLKKDITDSSEEVLWVDDLRLGERTEIHEGTEVTIYGSYTDTDEQDVPKIRAVFIDLR